MHSRDGAGRKIPLPNAMAGSRGQKRGAGGLKSAPRGVLGGPGARTQFISRAGEEEGPHATHAHLEGGGRQCPVRIFRWPGMISPFYLILYAYTGLRGR